MRTTILEIQKMKRGGQRIPMVTAYDATFARWLERAGIPMILVGDSLGMVVQGYETTLQVTLDEMIYHTRMVVRGTQKALVITDLPFMSYNISLEQALTSAGRAIKEGGATAVKLEGGVRSADAISRIVAAGIPVMGHIGLTPQSVYQLGGFRLQGKDAESAARLIDDALTVESAGAFSIVLETIPAPLAQTITEKLHIPTIGIGAGPFCDGQVQVFPDLVGMFDEFVPRHAKQYAHVGETILDAVKSYIAEVQSGAFPDSAHSFGMEDAASLSLYGNSKTRNTGGAGE